MSNFNTLTETSDTQEVDYFLLRQNGVDYKQKRSSMTANKAQSEAGQSTTEFETPAGVNSAMEQFGQFGRNKYITSGSAKDIVKRGGYILSVDVTDKPSSDQEYYLWVDNYNTGSTEVTHKAKATKGSDKTYYTKSKIDGVWESNWTKSWDDINLPKATDPQSLNSSSNVSYVYTPAQLHNITKIYADAQDEQVLLDAAQDATNKANTAESNAKSYAENANNLLIGTVPDARLPRATDAQAISGNSSKLPSVSQSVLMLRDRGLYSSTHYVDVDDFNDIDYFGKYNTGGVMAHAPDNRDPVRGWHVYVTPGAYSNQAISNDIRQQLVDIYAREEWIRYKINGVWDNEWEKIIKNDDIVSLGLGFDPSKDPVDSILFPASSVNNLTVKAGVYRVTTNAVSGAPSDGIIDHRYINPSKALQKFLSYVDGNSYTRVYPDETNWRKVKNTPQFGDSNYSYSDVMSSRQIDVWYPNNTGGTLRATVASTSAFNTGMKLLLREIGDTNVITIDISAYDTGTDGSVSGFINDGYEYKITDTGNDITMWVEYSL